jgi:hypothetical protein
MDRGSEHDQCEPHRDHFRDAERRHSFRDAKRRTADVFDQSGCRGHYGHDHTVSKQRECAGFII